MKAGTLPSDETRLAGWRRELEERARALEASGALVDAAFAFEGLAEDFPDAPAAAGWAAEARRIRASRAHKDALRDEREDARRQRQAVSELQAALVRPGDTDGALTARQTVDLLVAGLQKDLARGEATRSGRVARRTLAEAFVAAREAAGRHRAEKRHDAEAAALELADRVRPADPATLYDLACAYALDGRKAKALSALERAVAAGFADADRLAEDPDLGSLRGTDAYRKLEAAAGAARRGPESTR
jgi:hypothetical protein